MAVSGDPGLPFPGQATAGGGRSSRRRAGRRGPIGCMPLLVVVALVAVAAWAALRFVPLPILVYVNPLPYYGEYRWVVHPGQSQVEAIAFSPDGRLVASTGAQKTVDIWDATTGRTLSTYHAAGNPQVVPVAWAPDGNRVAISDDNHALIVLDASTGQPLVTVPGFSKPGSMAWSPDGQRVATAEPGRVRVWDGATGAPVTTITAPTADMVAWSPDGARLAAAGQDGSVRAWTVGSGQVVLAIPARTPYDSVDHLLWSSDGKHLAAQVTSMVDFRLSVWDLGTGQEAFTYRRDRSQGGTLAEAWSPDGGRLAIGGALDGSASVWDVASGRQVLSYGGHGTFRLLSTRRGSGAGRPAVYALAWSPDGTRIASLGSEDSVQVWDAATGRPLYVYDMDTRSTSSATRGAHTLAWSPDGSRLAIAGDRFAEVWIP